MRGQIRIYCSQGVSAVIIMIILSCLMGFAILASESQEVDQAKVKQRVFDQAGLMTQEQGEALEQKAQDLKLQTKMDLVVLTTSDAQGKTAEAFADDFYDQGNFGTGTDHSGALFLIDMDNRQIWISTSGRMIRYLTDERIEQLLDAAYDGVSNADYQRSIEEFLDGTAAFCDDGIEAGQYNYDTKTGRISTYKVVTRAELTAAIVAALIAAAIPCLIIKGRYGMKLQRSIAQKSVLSYQSQCQFSYSRYADDLVNKSITQRVIPKKPPASSGSGGSGSSRGSGGSRSSSSYKSPGRSSTHRSSSGSSHGGGGRKF